MIAKVVYYFERPIVLVCDARCDKAWGVSQRPRVALDPSDPDDKAWLADDELGTAPVNPGTYEGIDGKPNGPDWRLNRWCARECERCVHGKPGEIVQPRDWSRRMYNQPWKHEGEAK